MLNKNAAQLVAVAAFVVFAWDLTPPALKRLDQSG
jgi:hypothetical protein